MDKVKISKEMEMKKQEAVLEYRIKRLETSVRILEILVSKYAREKGIRVERFQDGLVVISQI